MASGKHAKSRHAAVRRVQKMYRKDNAGLDGRCVYCGNRADTLDHIPPITIATNLDLTYLKEIDPVLVPACQNCNSIIGASQQIKLVDRRDIVANHLETKKSRMLNYGRKIYEKNIPVINDFRDAACLNIFERFQFASLTITEVDEPEAAEEVYERKDFSKNLDTPTLSPIAWLVSWGIRPALSEKLGLQIMNSLEIDKRLLTDREATLLKLAKALEPLRGPFNWLRPWNDYVKLITSHDANILSEKDLLERFDYVHSADSAMNALIAELIEKQLISDSFTKLYSHAKSLDAEVRKSLRSHEPQKSNKFVQPPFLKGDITYLRNLRKNDIVTPGQIRHINDQAFKAIYSLDDQWPKFAPFEKFPDIKDLFISEVNVVTKEIKNAADFNEFIAELPEQIHDNILKGLRIKNIYIVLMMTDRINKSVRQKLKDFF